ncbi:hypothetical protein TRFO_21854 [Tritrichomonas foetus]|uniref:Uncharacterized protein n=1 Tax=Tritrichomonas foetus TaxID=1144522 RepID=A0A1J4KCY3_9EUKA|nr:hypothetical protein TRFO_21854 [Tritrichomonas foetus]|eukprot:OHT09287.1 hypothetical protein TRFO_21854 [Tritrichomonas foetus]
MEYDDFQEISFDDQDNADEQVEEQQQASIMDRSESIIYYKRRVQSLTNKVNRIRQKIQHHRKIQLQFAMLLNRTVENKYGPIVVEAPVQKQTVPPLPPIHKESRTELIRILHNNLPSDVAKYIERSNVISQLLFSDTSVFDSRLRESLMRASPDIQVSFFNATIKQIKTCGRFIDKVLPLLSEFANDSSLRSQIIDSTSNYSIFFKYYLKCLDTICKLAGFSKCKVVYSTKEGQSLIFPTEKFSHIINANDSICGILMNKKLSNMTNPQKQHSFDIICEGQVFEDYPYVLSAGFNSTTSNILAGTVIALSDRTFSPVDETHLSVIVEYLTPILKLYRSIFLQIAPYHFSLLTKSISSLRATKSIMPSFPEHICEICSAAQCRLLLSKPNSAFPEIPVLPEEDSLIRQSVKLKSTFSYKNARMRPDFNKNVDDYPLLPKIASMLVAPIKNSDFVVVLYNSTIASEFTPIQKSICDSFSISLPPLIHQLAMKRQMEHISEKHKTEMMSFEKTISLIVPAIKAAINGDVLNFMEENIKPPLKCYLFMKINENEALRFPGGDLVDVSDLLSKNENFLETDRFDVNIDAGGDENVKKVIIVSNKSCACILTNTENEFDQDSMIFYQRLCNILISLIPFAYLTDSLEQCKFKQQFLRDSIRVGLSSFSKLISAEVECKFYDPPLDNDPDIDAPLVVSIETPKGIEAALVSHDNSEETKVAILSYADFLTTAFANKREKETEEKVKPFLDLFIECGILEIFKCNREELKNWIATILPLVPRARCSNLQFLRDLLKENPWVNWFNQTQHLLIILCAFLRRISDNWECKTDKKTVERLKKCKPESCPTLAAVFATKFGLTNRLSDEEIDKLIDTMHGYISGNNYHDESVILTRIRLFSMHAFKLTDNNMKYLGQALVLFARIHKFTLAPATIVERLTDECGEEGRKAEIFVAERIFLPILSFLSQRHEKLLKMNTAVRESILEARKTLR